jgi:hypothetical protein
MEEFENIKNDFGIHKVYLYERKHKNKFKIT